MQTLSLFGHSGAVHLFEKQTNGTWSQVHKFSDHASNSDSAANRFTTTKTDVVFRSGSSAENRRYFGSSVSLSGNLLVVGAFEEDAGGAENKGMVYLFEKQTNGTWSQVHHIYDHTRSTDEAIRFTATNTDVNLSSSFYFGSGVFLSADGTLLAVGARQDTGVSRHQGAVYLFEKQTGGKWSQVHKFSDHTTSTNTVTRFTTAKTDVDLDTGDYLGSSVFLSADGTTLVVGARSDDDGGNAQGAVYLFSRQ